MSNDLGKNSCDLAPRLVIRVEVYIILLQLESASTFFLQIILRIISEQISYFMFKNMPCTVLISSLVLNVFIQDAMCNLYQSENNFSTGRPMKSLPDLLRENNLPQGLFPQNIACYEFDVAKSKLIVYLPSPCEVCFKDSSVLRYSTRIKATLSRGKLSGIEGMKTKILVWVKVTSVSVESYKSDKVWFTAGVKKSRPKDAYEITRDSMKVEEF